MLSGFPHLLFSQKFRQENKEMPRQEILPSLGQTAVLPEAELSLVKNSCPALYGRSLDRKYTVKESHRSVVLGGRQGAGAGLI